ncbi:MAG: LamG-like jellyroll fold domain-containing protein, partial [Nanoarchaeota archaeon]
MIREIIHKYALTYAMAIVVIMSIFTLVNYDKSVFTGFAVEEGIANESLNGSQSISEPIGNASENATAAENEAIVNETSQDTKESKSKKTKEEEKPIEQPKKDKGQNVPPVWKSDVNEFVINGKTLIDLNSYFYDDNNDSLTFASTTPEKILATVENNLVTLIPIESNFTAAIEFTASDGDKSTSKEVNLIVPEKGITISLQYKLGTTYDRDDNGYEPTTGVVDLTVENSLFSWDVDESNLCTKWEVYAVDEGKSTSFCYGGVKCCGFIGLAPTRDKWNEPFYSTYGQYGANLNNIVSAQIAYVDYGKRDDKPYAEIYNSLWQNLSANYYFASIDFENVCVGTCILSDFNESNYTLIFEIDGAILNLDALTYSIVEQLSKVFLSLSVKDDRGAVSGTYNLYKDSELVKDTEGFVDPDYYDIEVLPKDGIIHKLIIENVNITKPVTAKIGFDKVGNEITIPNVAVKKKYAVDLEQLEFEKAVLTSSSTANSLYKCRQWDYEREICFGSWEKLKSLKPGQAYNLTLTAEDPAFVEGDVNISGLELISEIPNLTIAANSQTAIDLSQYIYNIDKETIFTYYKPDNISIVFNSGIATVIPDAGFVGVGFAYITAKKNDSLAVSNVFSITVAAVITAETELNNSLEYHFDDGEKTNISYYAEFDGEKLTMAYKDIAKDTRKFGFVFNEKDVENELKAKRPEKSGKTFDKKIFFAINSSSEYKKRESNPFMLERNLTGQTKQIKNEIGQIQDKQLKRFLDFSDIFGKDVNLFDTTIQEVNESFCVLSSGEDCIEFDYRLVNKTVKKEREISHSFIKQGKNWIIEFFNLFDLDPSFIDDTDTNWNAGTMDNFTVIGTGTGANISSNDKDGHFASQIFDAGSASNWSNITIVTEAGYGIEINRHQNDSTEGMFEGINTTDLRLLLHLNNESSEESEKEIDSTFDFLSGLIAMYHFNNGTGENDTLVKDFSVELNSERTSAHNNATCTLCPVYNSTKSKINKSMFFDGSNVYLNISRANKTMPKNNFTFAMWAYTNKDTKQPVMFMIPGDVSGDNEFLMGMGGGTSSPKNQPFMMIRNIQYFSNVIVQNDTWFHFAGTRENNKVIIYVNGNPSNISIDSTEMNFGYCDAFIGIDVDSGCSGGLSDNFNGSIDEFGIWNRSLSGDEIAYLAGTKLIDYSPYQLNSSRSATPTNVSGKFGKGLEFHGDMFDYISVPYTALKNMSNFTVTFWIKKRDITNSEGIISGVLDRTTSTNDNSFLIFSSGTAMSVYHEGAVVTFTVRLNDQNWHHIAYRRSGTEGRVVQDGVSVGTNTVIDAPLNISEGGLIIGQEQDCVGGCFDATQALDGFLDEIAFWNRTLLLREINNIYKRGAYRMNVSARVCDDSLCAGETYKLIQNSTDGRKQQDLNLSATGRYFQYNITYSNESAYGVKAIVNNVTIDYYTTESINFTSLVNTTTRTQYDTLQDIFNNTLINSTINAVMLTASSNGSFLSRIFDLGTTQSFKNISWTEGAYYGEEIGRCVAEDSLITMTNGSKKKIKDIEAGEYVQSLDEKTGKIVANRVNELVDMGNKTVYELTTESGRAVNTTSNHPYLVKLYSKDECDKYSKSYWNKKDENINYISNLNNDVSIDEFEQKGYCTRWIEVSELKKEMEIAVPHNPSSLTKSEVEYTLIRDWFFSSLSSDQIAQLYLNAAAKYCISSGSGHIASASSKNGARSKLGITSILSSNTVKNLTKSSDDLCVFDDISSLWSLNSEKTNSGVIKSTLSDTNISAVLPSLIAAENSSVASTTNSIHISSLYFLETALLTSLPNFSISCSVSSLSDAKYFKNANSLAFFDIASLATLDQSTPLNSSIICLISSGTDTDTFAILSSPSKERENEYLNVVESDMFFEKITSIKPLDKQHVYDLNIENTHNFIANDIIAHNTAGDSATSIKYSFGSYPNISVNTSGLVGLWHFNNESAFGEATLEAGLNNKTVDFSVYVNSERATANANNGTFLNGATINKTNYKFGGGAGQFDGSDDRVQVDSGTILKTTPLSICAQFKNNGGAGAQTIFSIADVDSTGNHFDFTIVPSDSNKVYAEVKDASTSTTAKTSTGYTVGMWHHACVVFISSTERRAYIDGGSEGIDTTSITPTAAALDNTNIGVLRRSTSIFYFNGSIDEVAIWNRSLSSAEIMNLYKRGANRLNISVRSCDDSSCSGESFTVNATNSTLTGLTSLTNNRYIQYQANFERDNTTLSPELYNVTVHYAAPTETTFPIVNTTFNITSPVLNDVINFTGNITDETGLLSANITYNMSGELTKINFSLTGLTVAQVSNATQITTDVGSVINFTMYATDTSNNVRQNSTLITVEVTPVVGICDGGNLQTICWINRTHYVNETDNILSANNVIINGSGKIINSTSIPFTINLTGNLTIDNGGGIFLNATSCNTGNCANGGNLTIIANTINVSGRIIADGGKTTGNAGTHQSGTGGIITINASKIYIGANSEISASSDYIRNITSAFLGGDGGTINLNGTLVNISGTINARGGNGDKDTCGSDNRRGDGGIVNITSIEIVNTGLINVEKGVIGYCEAIILSDGLDGQIWVNNTFSPCNNGTIFNSDSKKCVMSKGIRVPNYYIINFDVKNYILSDGARLNGDANICNTGTCASGNNFTIIVDVLNLSNGNISSNGGSTFGSAASHISGDGGIITINASKIYIGANSEISASSDYLRSSANAFYGGDGGTINLNATLVNISGTINARGGTAETDICDSDEGRRGDGGIVNITAIEIINTGLINVEKGAIGNCGSVILTDGRDGQIWVNDTFSPCNNGTIFDSDFSKTCKISKGIRVSSNYVIDLSRKNFTLGDGARLNADGDECSTGTCASGDNFTIIVDVLNLSSGNISSNGGGTFGTATGHTSGNGSSITINASKIYIGVNSEISASSDYVRNNANTFMGGSGGTIKLNATLVNISGTINARGGNAENDACGSSEGRRGDGGIVNITAIEIINTGLINVEKGAIGNCGSVILTDGRDGQIWVNDTFSPCNNGTIFDSDFSKTCKISKGIRVSSNYVIDLSRKNFTLGDGARLNADGDECSTGTCASGDNFTIIVDVLNLSSGNISSNGGGTFSATGHTSGNGSSITINASKIYIGENSRIDSSSDYVRNSGSIFSGGSGGTIKLNATLVNISGTINARGGNGRNNVCDSVQGRRGDGGIVNITAVEIVNTGLINVEKGAIGYCELNRDRSGRDGQIWVNDTFSPCNNGTIFDSDFSKTCKMSKNIRVPNNYVVNLRGKNFTSEDRARLNADADICFSGTCNSGDNFTIIVDVLNLSNGNISSDGGSAVSTVSGHKSGTGGIIIINSSKIYVGANSEISASSDYVRNSGSIFSGGSGGTIKLNATLVNISGTINARGGNGRSTLCDSTQGIRGSGGSVFISAINAEIATIRADRGAIGFCSDRNGGSIFINATETLYLLTQASVTGNVSGNITLIAKELYAGTAILNASNGSLQGNMVNGTIKLFYNTTINISLANITPAPFIIKENEFGRIQFIDRISNYGTPFDLNKSINISSNLISVNSEDSGSSPPTGLNGSANLTIKGIANNTILRDGVACGDICFYLENGTDTNGLFVKFNVSQFTTYSINTGDMTFPIVNTTFNISSPSVNEVINFTGNVTDETGLLSANITYNISGVITKINFSLSGLTITQVSNVTILPSAPAVLNFTMYVTDTSNNVKQNSTLISVRDNVLPVVNTSLNISSPRIFDVVNLSANITDDIALISANITINFTTGTVKVNFSLSGTTAFVSNASRLPDNCVGGCVINYTVYATDTSNNVKQNSTVVTVIDNVNPRLNASLNLSTVVLKQVVNMTANVSDETGLSFCRFVINQTGVNEYFNKTATGTNDQCSQSFEISAGAGNVINFTVVVNDTSNNLNQREQIITVGSQVPITGCSSLTSPNTNYTLVSDVNSSGTCIYILGNNITLDCHGYKINYSKNVVGYGVNNSGYNYSTIKSCNIWEASDSLTSSHAIYIFRNSSFNTIFNNTITTYGVSPIGIYLLQEVFNTSIYNNNISPIGHGIALDTNVYNNSIYSNLINHSSAFSAYGVYLTSIASGNNIYDNIISSNAGAGSATVYLTSTVYDNKIYNNNITALFSGNSIRMDTTAYNNSIYKNILTALGNDVVSLSTDSYNNSVYENIINVLTISEGIDFNSAYNNLAYNNNITSSGNGIVLQGTAYNNTIYNNNITTTGTSAYGIEIDGYRNEVYNNIIRNLITGQNGIILLGGYKNSIYSNIIIINGSTASGISLSSSYNNTIYSNNITTSNIGDYGIYLLNGAFNNTIYLNNITTTNNTASYGIYIAYDSNNNTFNRNKITSQAIAILINGSGQTATKSTRFNTFTNDTIVPCSTGCASNYNDIVLTSNVTDITFLNVSFNKSRVAFIDRAPSVPREKKNITIQWYLSVNVTNSTNNAPLEALVFINDSFSTKVFNGTTDTAGGIPTQIITEYTQNGSVPFTAGTDTCTDVRGNENVTCFTPYNISVNITGYNTASRSLDVNRSKFVNISLTIISTADTTFPIVNTTFNISSPSINEVINFTGNLTDETGLLSANITYNISGSVTKLNFSISGTAAQVSNVTILPSSPAVINFTMFVTDTSNNVKQNSTLVSITEGADTTKPRINASLNLSTVVLNQVVNMTANVSDETGLSFCRFVINQTGVNEYFNKTATGTNDQCSQNFTISVGARNVINFTAIVNDTSNNLNQSGQIITIGSEVPVTGCGNLETPNTNYTLVSNVNSSGTCIYVLANNVTLDCHGYWINYSQNVVGYGINISTSNYSAIRSCNVVQNDTSKAGASTSYGIYVSSNSSFNTLYNNSIQFNNSAAIYLIADVYNSSVYNNSIRGSGNGVFMSNTRNISVFSNTIESSADGVSIGASSNNYVYSNTIKTSASNGDGIQILSGTKNSNFYNNTITSEGTTGIGINSLGTSPSISNSNNSIYDNNIMSNRSAGIYLDQYSYEFSIYDNNINGSYTGVIAITGNTYGTRVYKNNITSKVAIVPGVDLDGHNHSIYQNIIITAKSTTIGVDLTGADYNNSVYENIIKSSDNGVYVSNQNFENYIYSNNITVTGSSEGGVYLTSANYTSVYGNNITTTNSNTEGIFIDGQSQKNPIYENIIDSGDDGISLSNVYNNSIYNNIIRTFKSSANGITLSTASNNSIFSNNISTKGNNGIGIFLDASSRYNELYSNAITTTNRTAFGIFLRTGSGDNNIYENNITTLNNSGTYGIYLRSGIRNNTFFRNIIDSRVAGIAINGTPSPIFNNTFTNDTIISCSVDCSPNYQDVILSANATDITFLNVSFNKSRVAFVPLAPLNPVEKKNITIQWYLNINVTNSTKATAISGAQVVINDSFATNIFDGSTDATGGIATQIVTEFTMNGSVGSAWTASNDSCYQLKLTLTSENLTCFTPYNISVNITGYNTASRSLDVNRSKFVNISLTIISTADTTFPIVNTTFNISSPSINEVINFTGNLTDETGLLSANITYNISGSVTKLNFSISGTAAQVSNVTILPSSPAVINFTMFVTDTSNNVKQNSTLVSITEGADTTKPRINASLNLSTVVLNQVVNMTANVSDETGLSFCRFVINQTGVNEYFNKTATGTNDQCSQNFTISVGARNVINFTAIVNDTSNNLNQSGQIITIGSEVPVTGCGNLETPNTNYTLVSNVNSTGTCIYILGNNITLDCHGYWINYSQSVVGYGINISSFNYSTIRSCNIVQNSTGKAGKSNSYGVYAYLNSWFTNIYNNSIKTNASSSYGIYLLSNASNSNVTSNTITTSGGIFGYGILASTSSNNNNIYSNTITTSGEDGYGVYALTNSNNNNIYSNTITTSGEDGY